MGRAKALLIVVDPDEARDVPADVLSIAYKLTPAEIRLAKDIAAGCDLKTAAEIHGVRVATARNQLKSILSKTGTSRQGELVALLARLFPLNSAEGLLKMRNCVRDMSGRRMLPWRVVIARNIFPREF